MKSWHIKHLESKNLFNLQSHHSKHPDENLTHQTFGTQESLLASNHGPFKTHTSKKIGISL
jgi:hypothetical protein